MCSREEKGVTTFTTLGAAISQPINNIAPKSVGAFLFNIINLQLLQSTTRIPNTRSI